MSRRKIHPEKFSLVVCNPEIKKTITIPKSRRGIEGKTVGGKETYQMAIDHFTTRFQNKEELLDYAKENNLVKLPNINYDDLYVNIEYNGKGVFTGNTEVLYSDQKELIDFIDHCEIKECFSNNPYIEEFKDTIIKYWTTGMFQVEYKMFMSDYNNRYFGLDLIKILNSFKIKDSKIRNREETMMHSVKNGNIIIEELCHYHNIRGYFMTKNNLEDILYEITKTKIWSPQERIEYEKEERFEEEHDSSIPPIKLDIIKILEKKGKKSKKQLPNQLTLFDDYLYYDLEKENKKR